MNLMIIIQSYANNVRFKFGVCVLGLIPRAAFCSCRWDTDIDWASSLRMKWTTKWTQIRDPIASPKLMLLLLMICFPQKHTLLLRKAPSSLHLMHKLPPSHFLQAASFPPEEEREPFFVNLYLLGSKLLWWENFDPNQESHYKRGKKMELHTWVRLPGKMPNSVNVSTSLYPLRSFSCLL